MTHYEKYRIGSNYVKLFQCNCGHIEDSDWMKLYNEQYRICERCGSLENPKAIKGKGIEHRSKGDCFSVNWTPIAFMDLKGKWSPDDLLCNCDKTREINNWMGIKQ